MRSIPAGLMCAAALACVAWIALFPAVRQEREGRQWRSGAGPPMPVDAAARAPMPLGATPRGPSVVPSAGPGARGGGSPAVDAAGGAGPRWDRELFARLASAKAGDEIEFERVGSGRVTGTVGRLNRIQDRVVSVGGTLTRPAAGEFFLHRQLRPGVAGEAVGYLRFLNAETAYRLEARGPEGAPAWVERTVDQVVCRRLPRPPTWASDPVAEAPPLLPEDFPEVAIPAYQEGIVVLESLPGATPVLYLDFRGGYTVEWGMGGPIAYERPNVSNAEIREVWQRVAEDFLPFNLNVTTDLAAYERAPKGCRQRVLITPTDTAEPDSGGAARVGSFNWTEEVPCWVFSVSGKPCAEACSHELGHTLGLEHDGVENGGAEYYEGHGQGETGWAPIMGLNYEKRVTQWCRGEYAHANRRIDELAVIVTTNNEVAFRSDDTGDTLASARALEVYAGGAAGAQGVIERTGDTDAFQFFTAGGAVSLRADPVRLGANLAVEVGLYDAADRPLARSSPRATLGAEIVTNLAAGTYTFRVSGAGRGDPAADGFSAYGSLGGYTVTGAVANARLPDRFVLAEHAPLGTRVGRVAPRAGNSDPLRYAIRPGKGTDAFAIDAAGWLRVADAGPLDYEALARDTQLPVQFELAIDLVDEAVPDASEWARRVVVAIVNVNEAPSLTGFTAVLEEHCGVGTLVGRVSGRDPDLYTVLAYSILAGNSNGVFAIDSATGEIRVAGELDAAVRDTYRLTVGAIDQTPPEPLTATGEVKVVVAKAYPRGAVAYTVYTNIAGETLSALASAPAFPRDPMAETRLPTFETAGPGAPDCGAAMRGYLLPPATGVYTFWIAAGGPSELLLSASTESGDATRIAWVNDSALSAEVRQWDKDTNQQSMSLTLERGRAYYIEARTQAGRGPGHCAVAWVGPGVARQVIPGDDLTPFPMNYLPHPVGFDRNLHRNAIVHARVRQFTALDLNAHDTFRYRWASGNEDGLFDLDPASGWVRVASETALRAAEGGTRVLAVEVTDNGTPALTARGEARVRFVAPDQVAGPLRQELWWNITGSTVQDLRSSGKFSQFADALREVTSLDSGEARLGDSYGSRLRAWLRPTNSGQYTFFLAADDSGELSIQTRELRVGADGATSLVVNWLGSASVGASTGYRQWTRYESQRSAPIALTAGSDYYLEVLHKQGKGVDHVEVGWSGPGWTGTNPIPSELLRPVDFNGAPTVVEASFNQIVELSTDSPNGTEVIRLQAKDSPLDTLVYKLVSGNVGGTFALDPDTGRLTLADNRLVAGFQVSRFFLRVQAQDSGCGGLFPLQSVEGTVGVRFVDPRTPALWTGGGNDGRWSTAANWSGGPPGESRRLTFAGVGGRTNRNEVLSRVGWVTFQNGGFDVSGDPLLLLAGLASTGDNRWAIDVRLSESQTFHNLSGTLTLAGTIDNQGFPLTVSVPQTMRIEGGISGAGGLNKIGSGRLVLAAANSYRGRTRIQQGRVAIEHPDGLASSSCVGVWNDAVLDLGALGQPWRVGANQTLQGTGTLRGELLVEGVLDLYPFWADQYQADESSGVPYASRSLSALTSSNRVVLAGEVVMGLQSGSWFEPVWNHSVLRVKDELVYGGRLSLVYSPPDFGLGADGTASLQAGLRLPLFEAGRFAGAFDSFNLPDLGSELAWDTSALSVDGTLRVASAPPRLSVGERVWGGLTIQVQVARGLKYALESSSRLPASEGWSLVLRNESAGGLLSIVIPCGPGEERRFYRVRLE